ncbi:hypothetical protein KC367_g843 [Hortaea werneckii]|nr:hypothetical protein KC367_g843 [Hortaea werneckii]
MADSADNPPTDADHFVDFSEFDFPEFRPTDDGSAAKDESVTPGLVDQDPSHDTTGPSSTVGSSNDTEEPHRDSLMPAQSKKPGSDNSVVLPLGQSPSNSRCRGQTWQHDVPIRNSFPPKSESNEKPVKSKPALPPGLPPSSTISWQQEVLSDSTGGPRQTPLQFIHDGPRAIEIFNYDFKPLYNWLNSHLTPPNPLNLFIIMRTRPRDPTSPVPPSQYEADFKAGLTWLFLAASEHPALYTPGGTLELAFPALEIAEPLVLSFSDTIRMRHNPRRRRARHDRTALWQEASRPLGIAILFAQQMRSFGVGMGRVTNEDFALESMFLQTLYLEAICALCSSVTSILFPIFASYKALRTSDPANLAPWLMYWPTLSLFLLVESQLYFILYWVPFYSWIRLGIHLYLVAPGQQGSVYIYREYIHPFLEEHERQIDRMISDGHEKAKAAGMDVVKKGIEYVRVQILGQPPKRPSPPQSRNVSYSTYLMSKFAMPSAREGLAAAGTSDLFSLLGKALNQSTYPDARHSQEDQARDLATSGTLIPPHLSGDERDTFVNTQRERLRTLIQAFDAEAVGSGSTAGVASGARPRGSPAARPTSRKSYLAPDDSYMHKSRSESEFEDLAYEPMPDPEQYKVTVSYDDDDHDRRASKASPRPDRKGSGWSNFIWGSYGEKDSALNARKDL